MTATVVPSLQFERKESHGNGDVSPLRRRGTRLFLPGSTLSPTLSSSQPGPGSLHNVGFIRDLWHRCAPRDKCTGTELGVTVASASFIELSYPFLLQKNESLSNLPRVRYLGTCALSSCSYSLSSVCIVWAASPSSARQASMQVHLPNFLKFTQACSRFEPLDPKVPSKARSPLT